MKTPVGARASGRTTRMLQRALELGGEGKSVLVLVRDQRFIGHARRMLDSLGADGELDRLVMIQSFIAVENCELAGYSFDAVLEDHAVAEERERRWERAKRALERASDVAPITPPVKQSGGF